MHGRNYWKKHDLLSALYNVWLLVSYGLREVFQMAKENRAFEELLQKFYENELLREVYRTKKAVVCNAFDQFYIAFSLDLVESYTQDFPGFMMNSFGLKSILEDDRFVVRYFQHLSSKDQDDVLFLLDEVQFVHFQTHREEFRKRPAKVDLALEQELLLKGKDALKQEENAPKRKFFDFWKRK